MKSMASIDLLKNYYRNKRNKPHKLQSNQNMSEMRISPAMQGVSQLQMHHRYNSRRNRNNLKSDKNSLSDLKLSNSFMG
jgi:hypothetical protein